MIYLYDDDAVTSKNLLFAPLSELRILKFMKYRRDISINIFSFC